ncbi:MAG: 50S ribosomal protein L1 [Bacilli bacterium]|nr:50S ribosomal protein L1 [Bacilli bacterium]MBR4830972.1 50S ribosomal protein L1 [Bacilli bacterium]
MKKGKKYIKALELVDKSKLYTKEEAVDLVKKTSTSKFDASVEIAFNLNLDTKKTDQQLRGAIVLPNGTGKAKKVLVLTKNSALKDAAKEAGAEFIGDDDLVAKIEKENWLDYDVIIASPEMMPALGKLGKVLGPRGLMPNPKTGTVTTDIKKAVEDVKKGRIEYRTDSYGNIHAVIGKVSFDNDKLLENLVAIVTVIVKSKPQTVKGAFVKNISISSTMGPGIKIDLGSFDKLN